MKNPRCNSGKDSQEWVVFAGPPNSGAILDMESTQIMIVKDIIKHPLSRKYQHFSTHDLALVDLHESLKFSMNIGAACHVDQEQTIKNVEQCKIVGWESSNNGKSLKLKSKLYSILL